MNNRKTVRGLSNSANIRDFERHLSNEVEKLVHNLLKEMKDTS